MHSRTHLTLVIPLISAQVGLCSHADSNSRNAISFLLVSLYWNSGNVKAAFLVPVACTVPKTHMINIATDAMILSPDSFKKLLEIFSIVPRRTALKETIYCFIRQSLQSPSIVIRVQFASAINYLILWTLINVSFPKRRIFCY